MKYLKYILIVFILFLTPKVYASEFNMNSYTSATNGGTKNRYRSTEIYNTGMSSVYTFGTRYNGRISDIETYFDYPFEKNTTYRLTYNMSTEDFRNNFDGAYWWDCDDSTQVNPNRSSVSYISYKKIQVSFKPTENTTCIRMWIKSTSLSNVAITGVSNWNLSNITIYDPDWQSGSGSGQGTSSPTPTPTSGASNQDIINNQNNNTQDIINNNTQNTSDIIENNNQNTQDIINNQNELFGNCITNLWNGDYTNAYLSQQSDGYHYYLSSSGTRTVVVPVSPNKTYTIQKFSNTGTGTRFTIGGSTNLLNFGDMVPYIYFTDSSSLKTTINTNSNTNYLYIYITNNTSNIPFINVLEGTSYYSSYLIDKVCQSKLDETNSFLTDDSNPSISDNDFLNTFNSIGLNDPLSYLLTLPTQLINKIVTLSSSCTSINLGTLYGVMLTMPCINLENILGSTVWNIIDVIFSVSLLVVILKNLYDTFSNLLTMGAEKEAKEKFSMPTPMDFLAIILGGDR